MENKKEQAAEQKEKQPELSMIEKIKEELNISDAVFAGVAAYKGWAKGKQVTKKEMEAAINEFLNMMLK